jgi:ABC-type nickel/cobalt efflux system permease component RcnA
VIALAIVCLILAAAVTALMAVVGLTGSVTFASFAGDVVTQAFWVFLLGAATMLVALLGLSMLRRGTRRKVERRREIKRLRKVEQETHPSTTAPTTSSRTAGSSRGTQATDDTPDRTLVREERPDVDLRTDPGAVRTSPRDEGPPAEPRR